MRNKKLRDTIFAGLLVAIGIVLTSILSISYPPNSTIIRFGIGYLPLILISIILGPKTGFFSAIIQDIFGYLIYMWIFGPSGPFYIGFTFNAILFGVVPGILVRLKMEKINIFKFINIGLFVVLAAMGIWGLVNVEWIIQLIEDKLSADMSFQPWVIYFMLILGEVGILSMLIFTIAKRSEDEMSQRMIFSVIVLQIVVTLILTPLWVTDLYAIPYLPQLPLRIIKTPIEIYIYANLVTRIAKALNNTIFKRA